MTHHLETRGERLARKYPKPHVDNSLSRMDLMHRGLIEPPAENPWTPLWVGLGVAVVMVVLVVVLWIVGA